MAVKDNDFLVVKITPPAQSWCSAWSDIPIRLTITALFAEDRQPADNINFTMSLTSDTFEAEWIGEEEGYQTQTNGIQTVTGYIRLKEDATLPTDLSSVVISATFTDGDDGNGAPLITETHSETLYMSPVSTRLNAPYYPLAADGIIDEHDVQAGVYARILVNGSVRGDSVNLFVDEYPTPYTIETANEPISIKVSEALLTSGKRYSAYYAADFANNLSFSPVTNFIVSRDNPSGAITDLPAPRIPVADNNGVINMYDAENINLKVILDGEYKGEEVWKQAVPGSTCYVYWNSYAKSTGTLVSNASRKFEKVVTGDSAPDIANDYNNETTALKDLLYALGEGYVVVTYEMTIDSDKQLHASKENTFYVDVVPPGGRKAIKEVNEK